MLPKVFAVIDKVLSFIEDWILFLSTMVALIALFINVILRYGFNYSLAWSEELVREVIITTTFIGCSAAVKARAGVKIDVLPQLVPVTKWPIACISHLATLLFGGMMVYYGCRLTALQASTQQVTILLEIPLEYLYALLPMMGIMMIIRTLMLMYSDWQAMQKERAAKAA
jgi:TRAP-type C4-dicarboxylate transport system permease small subunit